MTRFRKIGFWFLFALVLTVPVTLAAISPQLEWRRPPYIVAGFAGILAMLLLLLQPLLAGNLLPGISAYRSRKVHRIVGVFLVIAVVVHVIGLWITSPPDVIDVLLFRSPTPFSVWGMIAMIALFITALVAGLRKSLRLSPRLWRVYHLILAIVIVTGSIVHAMLIEGTMELYSKAILCGLLVIVTGRLAWARLRV